MCNTVLTTIESALQYSPHQKWVWSNRIRGLKYSCYGILKWQNFAFYFWYDEKTLSGVLARTSGTILLPWKSSFRSWPKVTVNNKYKIQEQLLTWYILFLLSGIMIYVYLQTSFDYLCHKCRTTLNLVFAINKLFGKERT